MTFNPIRQWQEQRNASTQKRAEALRQQTANDMKESARKKYLQFGGSRSEFETEWPELKRRLLADKVARLERGK